MTLFLLDADINHFRMVTPAEYLEGGEPAYDTLELGRQFDDARSISGLWSPIRLGYVEEGDPIGDFPAYGSTPVFSGRAVNVLRDLLEPNGELLPTICPTHQLWVYKVLRFTDIMDWEKADIDWWPQTRSSVGMPRHARKVRRFAIRDERPTDPGIFKMPSLPFWYVFVNEEFYRRVHDAGLLGFTFKQVWPTPDDSAARKRFLEKHRRKKGR